VLLSWLQVSSIRFYDKILPFLGFQRLVCTSDFTAFSDGHIKLIFCPTDSEFSDNGFHRKRPGLNHLAFYCSTQEEVDAFYKDVLVAHQIETLYHEGPDGDDEYYAVFIEDPNRLKLEIVYAPHYCDPLRWPNNIASDFDPYLET